MRPNDFPLDLKQIQQVDDVLEKINKPIILTSIEGYPHMYFKYGLFTKDKSAKYHCVLDSKSYMNKLEDNFHNVLDFNQYSLWCKWTEYVLSIVDEVVIKLWLKKYLF